jgi:D-sedoheptulose 7-phosphate isomerase
MFDARHSFADARLVLEAFAANQPSVASVNSLIAQLAEAFKRGNKVLVCGNGGSLCDATHFAEELTGRFRKDRKALPAIACGDAGHITCVANDYGFEQVFSRFVDALGQSGDVLIVLSTSGNSMNCVNAALAAKAKGMQTWSLLGKDGGKLKGVSDHAIVVPGATADRIQEVHMLILHTVVEGVEVTLGMA